MEQKTLLAGLKLRERFFQRKLIAGNHKQNYEQLIGSVVAEIKNVEEFIDFLEEIEKDAI